LKKGAKTMALQYGDHLKAPTMTYGGDEEIVLKGGAKKA
jgi:hypothetical protein